MFEENVPTIIDNIKLNRHVPKWVTPFLRVKTVVTHIQVTTQMQKVTAIKKK